MSYFILRADDLVFPDEMAVEIMAMLAKGTPVNKHWSTKEFTVEDMTNSNASLVPFPAASYAQAVLNRANADEEARNSA